MTTLRGWTSEWLHSDTVRTLALTLGHFVWEGLALAAILFCAMSFCRRAQTRYLLAVCTLAAMLIAPVWTFKVLSETPPSLAVSTTGSGPTVRSNAYQSAAANHLTSNKPIASTNWPAWCACMWFAGVLVFSTRALGGWIMLMRFRRKNTSGFPGHLLERCRIFEQRLGLRRRIRYLQSTIMDTPSVAGWLRPVVLMPVSALSGLSPEQLEAVIVHELAHVKRLDGLVNLFQIAVETLLFYHPAVWWTNRVIRNERENCCDDVSVQVCGNAKEYAKALTLLESGRSTPSWALSATGGLLRARVMRLLFPQKTVTAVPSTGVAMLGIFCATAILASAGVFAKPDWKPVNAERADTRISSHSQAAPAAKVDPVVPPAPDATDPDPAPDIVSEDSAAPTPQVGASAPAHTETSSDSSYIAGLKSAGLKDLTVEEVISLKIQGVTPEYVNAMHRDGFDPNVHDLVALKVQGISADYVRDMRAAGLNPAMRELIGLKVQGITPQYVQEMKSMGLGSIGTQELIGMKVQGIDPAYVRAIHAIGLGPNVHELIGMKVQNVTPEYIRALKAADFADLGVRDFINAKVHNITPEFIAKVRSHGFKNLTLHQLIALKNADVF